MRQLILSHSCWLAGNKGEVIEHLQRLEQTYGDISIKQLLKLLQH